MGTLEALYLFSRVVGAPLQPLQRALRLPRGPPLDSLRLELGLGRGDLLGEAELWVSLISPAELDEGLLEGGDPRSESLVLLGALLA